MRANDKQASEVITPQANKLCFEPFTIIATTTRTQVSNGFALDAEMSLKTFDGIIASRQARNFRRQAREYQWCLLTRIHQERRLGLPILEVGWKMVFAHTLSH